MHVCEVQPRKDNRGVDLLSDRLPFGRLWCGKPNAIGNAVGDAKHRIRSHDAVIRVYGVLTRVAIAPIGNKQQKEVHHAPVNPPQSL